MVGGKKIVTTYYPNEYQKYKDTILLLVKSLNIPKQDYYRLNISFHIPFPKQFKGGKKAKIEGLPCRAKYDLDNMCKGLMDALTQANVIEDDRQLCELNTAKVYTNTNGYILFELG